MNIHAIPTPLLSLKDTVYSDDIGQTNEELIKVMADELIEHNIIKEEHGQYYFCESGEPLIPDEDWENEEEPSIEQIKADAPEGAVYWSRSVEQYLIASSLALLVKRMAI